MTICKHCSKEFTWADTPEGKRPINKDDGLEHWRTCVGFRKEARSRWNAKKKKARGPHSLAALIERRRAKYDCPPVKITGEKYKPVDSSALPWEDEPIGPEVDAILEIGGQA